MMSELGKRNPGILGWDPNKQRPSMEQRNCPYCWFAHHNQGVLTKHINDYHWREAERDGKQATSRDNKVPQA